LALLDLKGELSTEVFPEPVEPITKKFFLSEIIF
jgi:hypothetical protein